MNKPFSFFLFTFSDASDGSARQMFFTITLKRDTEVDNSEMLQKFIGAAPAFISHVGTQIQGEVPDIKEDGDSLEDLCDEIFQVACFHADLFYNYQNFSQEFAEDDERINSLVEKSKNTPGQSMMIMENTLTIRDGKISISLYGEIMKAVSDEEDYTFYFETSVPAMKLN